jgi:hypothetical protein
MKTLKIMSALASTLIACSFGSSSASAAQSNVIIQACIADETYDATSRVAGWLPTNLSSPTVDGLSTGVFGSRTATTNLLYTGSTPITKSALVADASLTYGIGYAVQSNLTKAWSYAGSIPTGSTGRILVLHKADKITFTKYVNKADCSTDSYPGLVAYVPYSTTLANSYCSIVDVIPNKTNWSTGCVD